MKRILSTFLLCLLLAWSAKADFKARGGQNGFPYDYNQAEGLSANTGLEHVFVFDGMHEAELVYETTNPNDYVWYRYQQDVSSAETVEASLLRIEGNATVLSSLESGYGYLVRRGDEAHVCFICDYSALSFQYQELKAVENAEDICESLQLVLISQQDDIVYRTVSGTRKTIDRVHTLTWTDAVWDEETAQYSSEEKSREWRGYVENMVVDAPCQNTFFELKGDRLADYFGKNPQIVGFDYQAVKVCTNAQARSEQKEKSENELSSGSESSTALNIIGAAPCTVHFDSYANEPTLFYVWRIYTTPNEETSYLRRTESAIEYTFYEAGTYKVCLNVSNHHCEDSATFTVRVTESSLDCPNFFSPRSTPGENDEFRVAYTSLVDFHGRILNRWGNLLFEWTDPSMGWDGTYRGKPVSPGVYFYVITATGSDGIRYSKKGDINLLE